MESCRIRKNCQSLKELAVSIGVKIGHLCQPHSLTLTPKTMPYIPHTPADISAMLATIGIQHIDDLFDEIPTHLRCGQLDNLSSGLTEMEIARLIHQKLKQDPELLCFTGAGAYSHYIPAPVWDCASRGEFYSAYTPYQAEASQGTLQLLYEFQTLIAHLLGMEVANASLYDGASALAESVLMAIRLTKSSPNAVLMPTTVHPLYRRVVQTITKHQGIQIIDVPFEKSTGRLALSTLEAYRHQAAALVIPQPNFFGQLELVDELTDWAHQHNMLVIGVVNPIAMAILSAPGEWGKQGADIACGEGQPLGIPLSSGGPYLGLMTCKKSHIRQMPGRIVGKTVDKDGKVGYTLTLQAREQHIRRSKATSNICTNQGLMVTAATIYMSLLGISGLEKVASHSHTQTTRLLAQLTDIPGVQRVFEGPYFHEVVLQLNQPVDKILQQLLSHHILGGYALPDFYPDLENSLLICATETRTDEELTAFATALRTLL